MTLASIAKVRLPAASGILRDDVTNTFAFVWQNEAAGDLAKDIIRDALKKFYNGAGNPAAGDRVSGYINGSISRAANACEIKHYDLTDHMAGTPAGSPDRVDFFTLGSWNDVAGVTAMPNEVAAVLSFRADYGNSLEVGPADPITGKRPKPKARHRGRVYIGPLTNQAGDTEVGTGRRRLWSFYRDLLAGAADTMRFELQQSAIVNWAVWSRKDAIVRPVLEGFVDDAFDTVRSRGQKATARSVFS